MLTETLATRTENTKVQGLIPLRSLTRQQQSAIRTEAAIGDQIRRDFPLLAEEYRMGLTAPRLVDRHELDRRYDVSRRAAVAAVRNALRGYAGYFHDSYEGLISDQSERARLALAHNRQTGIEAYQQRRGLHALTSKQKAEAGRKGGLILGPMSYRLRFGCHARPPEVQREHLRRIAPLGARKGAVACVLARGLVLYVPATEERCSELEFAYRLSTNSHYLGPVRANFNKIAEKVNEVFYSAEPRYTRITLKIALQRYRRLARSTSQRSADPEMAFAEFLASDPAFQTGSRIKMDLIARTVNLEYHGDQPVRNAIGIRAAIRRYRRQISGVRDSGSRDPLKTATIEIGQMIAPFTPPERPDGLHGALWGGPNADAGTLNEIENPNPAPVPTTGGPKAVTATARAQ